MAGAVVKDNQISLNGYIYEVNGEVNMQSVDPFPDPVRFGDASYDNKKNLSAWTIICTGGIGNENYRTSEPTKTWWTNYITEYPGHILPPRLATKVATNPATPSAPTITNADFESDVFTGWSQGQGDVGDVTRSSTQKHGGTYSWRFETTSIGDYVYQDMSTYLKGGAYTFTVWHRKDLNGTNIKVGINDGVDTTYGYEVGTTDTWVQATVTKTLALNATQCRLIIYMISGTAGGAGTYTYIDDAAISIAALTVGNPNLMANFNGELYFAFGTILCKLASGRASYDLVADMGETITALIASLDSKLYIFFGDTADNYWYMTTAEVLAESDEYGYWSEQFDNKLFWITTDGTVQYAADPDNAAVDETAGGTITDIASQIERFFVGRDAAGSPVLYCATNTILKVLDIDTPEWLDTEVRLPLHPNGGKGACYFNGRIYLSNGLAIKEYNPETGYVREIGLTERDGLPVEYNGEIVFLLGDSASKGMFALFDASQTSGNSYSGLYKWNDDVWECWWIDTTYNQAMTEAIVSSAESGYAIYWGVGSDVYYIDIPRGIQNPDKISQSYATSGLLITSWFNADSATASKLAKEILALVASSSATEYVVLKYRINKTYTDIATGWNTINTYNSTAENTVNTETFASGAGISFQTIQFRLDFTTAGSTSKPDIQELTLWFKKNTGSQKQRIWTVPIHIDDDQEWRSTSEATARQKWANLETARISDTDVAFYYHDTAYYVDVDFVGTSQTGQKFAGDYQLTLVES